jgi:uncharacterized repeat protein (TIGR01451 family)
MKQIFKNKSLVHKPAEFVSKSRNKFKRFIISTGIAVMSATTSVSVWAICPGVALSVGYDFAFGAKTGIQPLDAGTCVPNATTVALAGDDYCSGEGGVGDYIIRTNDGGVATLKYTFNTGTIHTDYTIVVDIPQTGGVGATGASNPRPAGQDIATWQGIPSSCTGAGSAISNGGKRLTCNLGTIDATAGQITVAVPASFKVSPRALNSETFALQSNVSSSGGSTGACAAQPAATASQALTVSARPKIDIKTTVQNYFPTTYTPPGGVPTQGYFLDYYVYIDGLNNATVGGEAVQSPLNFNVGLSNDVPVTGVTFVQVFSNDGNTTNMTTTTPEGTLAGNGVNIPVRFTPTTAGSNCAAEFLVPGAACVENPTGAPQRLATKAIRYFVPLTAFPTGVNQINFLNFLNSNGSSGPAAISTPPASGVGSFSEPVSENSAPYTAIRTLPGSYAKYTDEHAYYNATTRPPGASLANIVQMPGEAPGNFWCVGGECKQYPTRPVEAMIHVTNRGNLPWTNTIVCDKFDNNGMVLTRRARAGGAAHLYPSNMPGDVITAMYTGVQAGTMPGGYTVEVATVPASGTPPYPGSNYPSDAQNCGDGDASWVDANSVTNYAPYNIVRIKIPTMESAFVTDGFISPVFHFTVPTTAPNGRYIGNQMRIKTDTESFGGTLGSWSTGVFNPITNSGVYTGERFQVVKALVRTQKEAYDRFGNLTSILGAGKSVAFKLSPSYTAAPGVPSPNATIDVVDVLPIPLTYVASSARTCPGGTWCAAGTGTPLAPSTITIDGSGRQVLTWSLPNVVLNSSIPPIYFDAEAPQTLPAGTIVTNVVTVAAPAVDQSTDAERSASKALTIDNVAGFFVTKKVSTPLIPVNGSYFYTLEIANLKSTAESLIDVIDVLPRPADPRVPTSAFAGTRFLTGPVTGASATVRYTNAAVGAPPTAASSTIGGTSALPLASDFAIAATTANGWCLQAEFGNPGCPANFAAVTGFRASIPSIAGNSTSALNAPMGTNGNADGNIYTNRFAMGATGFGPLFSNDVVTTVKQATLAGKVYVDSNLNSQPDGTEPPIAGVLITLCNVATPIPCPTGNIVATTNTLADGTYKFTNLSAGTYFVRESQPAGYLSAGANIPGTAGGTVPSPDAFDGVSLIAGQDATNYNFGERPVSVSGNVFNDAGGLVTDSFVNGTGTEAGPATTLTAYLVKADGTVAAASDVSATGAFSFPNVMPANGYTVVLSNTPGVTAGSPAPAPSLPPGWVNTGEVNGNTTTANTEVGAAISDGKSAPFNVGTTDVIDRNFGIEQPPVAGIATYSGQPNPGGTTSVPVGAGAFTGALPAGVTGTNATDPTAVTQIRITTFPTNAETITIKGVVYTPATFAAAAAVPGAPALTMTIAELANLAVNPVDGLTTVTIPYVAIDAAGKESGPGSVILPFTGVTVSGNVYNDIGGLVSDNFVNGPGTEASPPAGSTLTAYLINSSGNVVSVSDVSGAGAFSFGNVGSGTGYTVVLSNVATIPVGSPAPAPSLPAGWFNTGEVNGNTTTPNTEVGANIADGKSAPFTVAGADVIDRNFGIERAPVPGVVLYVNQPNPGNFVAVPVDGGAFTGTLPTVGAAIGNVQAGSTNATDPDGGAVTSIKITALPTNATSITIGGTTYGTAPGNTPFPAAGVTVPATPAGLAGITVDPIDGAVVVDIPYRAIDIVGKESIIGNVRLPFGAPSKIDVVKAVGLPLQTGPATYEVPYDVVVGNVGVSNPTIYNVQADDNLKSTFPTATSITIKAASYVVTPIGTTPAAQCQSSAPPFAGTAAASKMLSGTGDLAGGQACEIKFVAIVTFASAATVPTGIAQNNTVYASGVGANATANPGYNVPDTGPAVPPAVATTTDISVDNVAVRPPAGSAPGTPPGTPTLPATSGGDAPAGVVTPVILTPQKIDVVKAVGLPLQTGLATFEIPYSVVVGNVGATSPIVFNVQADDNLKLTFPTATSITIKAASYVVTPVGTTPAAQCQPSAPAFAGTAAASKMLSGTGDLAGGQACEIKFAAVVTFASAATIPTGIAQNNTVYASGVGLNTVANPGYSVPDTGPAIPPAVATTTDISVDNVAVRPPAGSAAGTAPGTPTLPATSGGDAPAGVVTPVVLAPQKIDVVKAVGVPEQVAPTVAGTAKFEIPYSVVVGNVGATSPIVFNVQADDNLKLTFPTATSITIKAASYVVTPVGTTPAAQCQPSAPAFAGTAVASKMLSGTGDLAGGQACEIKFIAVVTFASPAAIPVGIAQNNTVYASGVGVNTVPNPGYSVPDTGPAVAPAVATTTDVSVDNVAVRPPAGSAPGTPPGTPTLPATPGSDAPNGVVTPVVLTPQKIDVVKAAGVPKQVGAKLFEISYAVVVGNVGATSPTLFNVQADDNLKLTFPTATSYAVSNYAVVAGAGTPAAACMAAVPPFLGTAAASKMLKGDGDLAGGQSCVITFKVTVDFTGAAIPTVSQNNTVFTSAVGANTIPNPGYSVPDTGLAVPPAVGTTIDISATAPPTSGPPGTLPAIPPLPTVAGGDVDVGIPTPVIFVLAEDGEILVSKSTPTKVGSAGDVVEYTVVVRNTSSNAVTSVKVTDTPPVGFEYVAGSGKVSGVSATTVRNGNELIFEAGSIAAKSSVELRYQMKLGDAVEAGEATNCVAARGTDSLTGTNKESGKSCVTVIIETGLFLEKRVNVNKAELGDSVEYSLRVKSVGGTTKNVKITDNMPLGFKLIAGTVKVIRGAVTSAAFDPAGAPGPQTVFSVGTVANKEVVEIRYRVRLSIGSDLGDGINRAQAKAPFARSSLIATAKVEVTRGVFTREACVIGKVFVDCNQNKVQDACVDEAGKEGKCSPGEPGIPGVRLYMEDGTNITTDENGQYSICGIRAISHVMQVDMTTMPVGSRMGLTSNRNLGDGVSLLMNPKAGELYRADFIESSCYPKILEQVEQRKQNGAGAVTVPLKQVGQDKPGIVFDSKEQELLHPSLRSPVGGVK